MALRRRWSYLALFSAVAMVGAACSGGSTKEDASKKADQAQAAAPATPETPTPSVETPAAPAKTDTVRGQTPAMSVSDR